MNHAVTTTQARRASITYVDHVNPGPRLAEATEWSNGEGVDVHLGGDDGCRHLSLSRTDIDAVLAVLGVLGCMASAPTDTPVESLPPAHADRPRARASRPKGASYATSLADR